MNKETIKLLQTKELSMAKSFISICKKHNLRYFMLGGTLLGAVRHQGFIPWDDDMDFGMPRKDYDELLKYVDELPANLEIKYYKNDESERPIYFYQLRDNSTEIIQHIAAKDFHTNVWIDIFPLDGMPNHLIVRKIHSLILLFWRMRIQFSMFDENVHLHRKNRPWHEKVLIKLFQITRIGENGNTYKIMDSLDKALRKYSFDHQNHIINFMGAWKFKEMFPIEIYGKGKTYMFEGEELIGPQDADYVLKQMYGDYMKPIENSDERYEHHSIEIKKL